MRTCNVDPATREDCAARRNGAYLAGGETDHGQHKPPHPREVRVKRHSYQSNKAKAGKCVMIDATHDGTGDRRSAARKVRRKP